jgi:hypothetical protein
MPWPVTLPTSYVWRAQLNMRAGKTIAIKNKECFTSPSQPKFPVPPYSGNIRHVTCSDCRLFAHVTESKGGVIPHNAAFWGVILPPISLSNGDL